LLPGQWENALTPIYPSLALAGAIALKEVRHFDPTIPYPKIWRFAFFGFSFIFIALTISLYSNFPVQILPQKERPFLLLILIFFSLTLAMTANLLAQRQTEFIPILFWGMFISLLLWVNTPFWLWPQAGDFPVTAIAALIQKKVPASQPIYASFSQERSSLSFYSHHPIIPANTQRLRHYWQSHSQPYLLIDKATSHQLALKNVKSLGKSLLGWQLITKQP